MKEPALPTFDSLNSLTGQFIIIILYNNNMVTREYGINWKGKERALVFSFIKALRDPSHQTVTFQRRTLQLQYLQSQRF
jgi:hypothetical protein